MVATTAPNDVLDKILAIAYEFTHPSGQEDEKRAPNTGESAGRMRNSVRLLKVPALGGEMWARGYKIFKRHQTAAKQAALPNPEKPKETGIPVSLSADATLRYRKYDLVQDARLVSVSIMQIIESVFTILLKFECVMKC